MVKYSGDIVLSHLLPVESPVLRFVLVVVVVDVAQTVGITTRVSEPNIVTTASCNEGRCNFRPVHHPSIARVENAVLQQNGGFRSRRFYLTFEAGNTPDSQDVAILGNNRVLFELETVLHAKFLESKTSIARSF